MNREELRTALTGRFPTFSFGETTDFTVMWVNREELFAVAKKLHDDAELRFDFLFCETAVDRKEYFEVVYHLSSSDYKHSLEVKVKLADRNLPSVDSVASLWQAAEWYENEIFDLFGIRFLNHPNLRRIFLSDEWIGYPLRKDYRDDVNILSL